MMPLEIRVRIHVGPLGHPGELSRADRLAILRGQLTLLCRRAEESVAVTVDALARAEALARTLELPEVQL